MCDRVTVPARSCERVMFKAMSVKPKIHWRPQGVGDSRNGKCLLKKTTGSKWNQPKREAMLAATSKATGVGMSKVFEVHIISPQPAQDAEYEVIGFHVCFNGV